MNLKGITVCGKGQMHFSFSPEKKNICCMIPFMHNSGKWNTVSSDRKRTSVFGGEKQHWVRSGLSWTYSGIVGTDELLLWWWWMSPHFRKYAKAYRVVHFKFLHVFIFHVYLKKAIENQSKFIVFILLKMSEGLVMADVSQVWLLKTALLQCRKTKTLTEHIYEINFWFLDRVSFSKFIAFEFVFPASRICLSCAQCLGLLKIQSLPKLRHCFLFQAFAPVLLSFRMEMGA